MSTEMSSDADPNLMVVADDLKAVFKNLCPPGGTRGEQSEFVEPTLRVYREQSLNDVQASTLPYVAWRCDVSFTGKIRFLGRTVHSGLHPPRGKDQAPKKTLTLNGISLIREADGTREFLRYIEWYPFLSELGLVAAVRPAQSSEDLEGEEDLLRSAQTDTRSPQP